MQTNQFCIVILSLIAKICATGIILNSNETHGSHEVDEAAIGIITSCYENRGNAVGIGGIVPEAVVKRLSSYKIPVVLGNNNINVLVRYEDYQTALRYKLQVFVLAASTNSELEKFIIEIRGTVWWNHMAYFLILYRSSRGCNGADPFLIQAWNKNMPNAKLICFHRNMGTMILGFNPYSSKTPELWKLGYAYAYKKWTNNYFVIFDRIYREGKEVCKNLDFDKMKNLYGYPIEEMYPVRNEVLYTGRQQNLRNDANMYDNVLGTIFRVLNATKVVIPLNETDGNQRLHDMMIGIVPMVSGLWNPVSRPFTTTGLVAMTQHSGHLSQLQKIVSIVDIYSNIGICIVLVITLLFFTIFVRQPPMLAALNALRIVCNTGFRNVPQNTPSKLYIITVLLFTVTMQGIYQGNFASLLTTVVPFPNVDTWEDLAMSNYTIYIEKGNNIYFTDPVFYGRIVRLDRNGNCAKYVLHSSSVACVDFEPILKDQAEVLKLHLSDALKVSLGVVRFRRDWPHERQFNILLGKLYEADVVVPFNLRANQKTLNDFKFDDDVIKNKEYRSITLRDLTFAFVFLGIGSMCSAITFFFEIIINRFHTRTQKVRKIRPRISL